MTPSSPEEHHHHTKKKRVGKACDLCRIKKTKCDGKKPCSRCIADNKLCAFTDKKKHKEKIHPSGYIDLLETRLDILTKSLEKIVQMAEPHLPFLQDLMAKARAEHVQISLPESVDSVSRDAHYVPINEVVAYLISDLGLLDKEPVEWERGAEIAAKLLPTNINESALDFANHKLETLASNEGATAEEEAIQLNFNSPVPTKLNHHSRTSSSESVESTNNYASSITEQLNLDNISLGGFSTAQLQHPQAQLLTSLGFENFPKRANLLFINNNDIHSSSLLVSSLVNRFENQDLEETTRRRGLGSFKGPLSPSHQKMKLNGHVHKRGFQSHGHQGVQNNNFISNNGNEFHLPKQFSSTLSLPDIVSSGLSKNLDIPETVFDDDFLFDDLPSRYEFGDYTKSGLLDGEDILINNPLLNAGQ